MDRVVLWRRHTFSCLWADLLARNAYHIHDICNVQHERWRLTETQRTNEYIKVVSFIFRSGSKRSRNYIVHRMAGLLYTWELHGYRPCMYFTLARWYLFVAGTKNVQRIHMFQWCAATGIADTHDMIYTSRTDHTGEWSCEWKPYIFVKNKIFIYLFVFLWIVMYHWYHLCI